MITIFVQESDGWLMRWAEKNPLLKVETGVTRKQKEEQNDAGRQCAKQKAGSYAVILFTVELE